MAYSSTPPSLNVAGKAPAMPMPYQCSPTNTEDPSYPNTVCARPLVDAYSVANATTCAPPHYLMRATCCECTFLMHGGTAPHSRSLIEEPDSASNGTEDSFQHGKVILDDVPKCGMTHFRMPQPYIAPQLKSLCLSVLPSKSLPLLLALATIEVFQRNYCH